MRIVRSGGANGVWEKGSREHDAYGFGGYFMLGIKAELEEMIRQGKLAAVCTAAKPNKFHYDGRLRDMGFELRDFVLLGREDEADWGRYSAVLLLGGETRALHDWLDKTKFSREALVNCELLGGDSAGAYVLAGKTLVDYDPDGERFEIVDGFLPGLNQLIAAHVNNPHYYRPGLSVVLREWCDVHGVEYVELE